MKAGYSSQQSFTYAFRRLYGHPPQAYRAIRIHEPRCDRFKPESKLILLFNSMKCEGRAA